MVSPAISNPYLVRGNKVNPNFSGVCIKIRVNYVVIIVIAHKVYLNIRIQMATSV